ncbi:hypothetical protein B9Q12_02280 [Candidatus Marsarchaeota G2 archaeon ECH_B_SAG-G06]|uniref:Glycosyltransferase 2-like domain-containing protein n=1 Tax=Candidatus Marsarchaeota G2 archaeon ECH_B_SAG-G06 TaxID=1978166 RepID=A0A2R6C0Y6_9ARCH|nr:MAG: hypothetical protein B9Q12_02280 [Candidatus Marsarchaeota G2 archaeon ECH_B_SAG-G06]
MDENDLITVCVCTYNSGETIESCLTSIKRALPRARLIVVDHESSDETLEVAKKMGAEIYTERIGLGYARQLCFELVRTPFISFVDSDVQIVDKDFFKKALLILSKNPKVGAVVGLSVGHRFAYGLPASLLVLRMENFQGKIIPAYIDARETYFIQKRLEKLGLQTVYLFDSMIHRSRYRKHKPEWEGANTRLLNSSALKELVFAAKVVLLMSLNSRDIKNIAYTPIFYLKFLRGFANPLKWRRLERRRRV